MSTLYIIFYIIGVIALSAADLLKTVFWAVLVFGHAAILTKPTEDSLKTFFEQYLENCVNKPFDNWFVEFIKKKGVKYYLGKTSWNFLDLVAIKLCTVHIHLDNRTKNFLYIGLCNTWYELNYDRWMREE